MQGLNPGQGSNQEGNKSGGLSWSSPQSNQNSTPQTSPLVGGAKPAQSPAPTPRPAAAASSSSAAKSPSPVMATRPRSGERNNSMQNIWSFIAGLVVGIVLMWSWGAVMSPTNSNTATTTPNGTTNTGNTTNTSGSVPGSTIGNSTSAPGISTSNDLIVLGQDADDVVFVKDASVSAPTWLVVYELYQGKPIRALGATMFFPEYNGKGGIINLLRATQPNTTYFVGQSLDSGDHTFTPHVNKEVLGADGTMVGTTFKTN